MQLATAATVAVLASVAVVPVPAVAQQAQDEERAVRVPVRLTASSDNSLMGVLSADESALYFISDVNATFELYAQAPVNSGPTLLFDGFGDVAWPAPSPDGRSIAYVSYVRDATGDACLRPLESALTVGAETCVTGPGTAELQAAWLDQGDRLAVLSRPDLHSDFRLLAYAAGSSAAKNPAKELVARNMTGVALSPTGRWLAYNPVERRSDQVGPAFANRTARGIRVQRLDSNASPIDYVPDLPGVTGYMAFSRRGDYLYFTQYLNDTNRDRVIDGNDNSVLFRVPFADGAKTPISAAIPEQLTSAEWNCHYPAPAASQLIMTCSHAGSLDVYSIALEGAVPLAWDNERIAAEVDVSRDLWTRLLLYGRLLARAKDAGARGPVLAEMAMLHLRLREYESAVFYARQLATEAGDGTPAQQFGRLIAELAEHRRADDELARGELSRRYVRQERKRRDVIADIAGGAGADIAALAELIASELDDDLGDKGEALRRLESVDVATISDPATLLLASQRAQALYSVFGDRASLVALLGAIAQHPALSIDERLRYADMTVSELVRGVVRGRRVERLQTLRKGLDDDSELALMLEVEMALNDISDDNQEQVRERVFDLFKRNEDPARRRAISLATVQAAARLGNEYLQYQFTTSWASGVKRADPERKYAEDLYRTVVLERAYGEYRQNISDARAYFFGATMNSSSLEAHAGFIEAYAAEGKENVRAIYEKRFGKTPDDPLYLFAQAYLEARELPDLSEKACDQAVDRVQELLGRVAKEMPRRAEVHHLWGYAMHQRARRTKSREAALAANRHYLLALDLARERPRLRAAVLQAVGLLTASLGNHRRALEHFDERLRLPFVRPSSELSLLVARARSLYFVRRDEQARENAQKALALADKHPELARFRPLILDRLALYHLSAGEASGARDRYRELLGLLENKANAPDGPVGRRNLVRARVGLASALLRTREYDQAVAVLDKLDDKLEDGGPLYGKNGGDDDGPALSLLDDYRYTRQQYRILSAGLRAVALRGLGRLDDARAILEKRRTLLQSRFDEGDADEDLFDLAQTSYQLARVAYEQDQLDKARSWLKQGLTESALYNERTGSVMTDVHLALVRAYAELHLYGGVARRDLRRDLKAELTAAYEFITEFRNPEWARERFLFGLYLTMIKLDGVAP